MGQGLPVSSDHPDRSLDLELATLFFESRQGRSARRTSFFVVRRDLEVMNVEQFIRKWGTS